MARRPRGAVARAIEDGARAEDGMDGLLAMAQPIQAPEDIGNFSSHAEPSPARGARRAEARRATVTPFRRPARLPTFDDERLLESAARETGHAVATPGRREVARGGLPSAADLEEAGQPIGWEGAAEPEDDEEPFDELEEGDEAAEYTEGLDARDPRDRELAQLRRWYAEADEREAERAAREAAAIAAARVPGAAAPGAAAGPVATAAPVRDFRNDPRAVELARRNEIANLCFFNLDDPHLREVGWSPAQARALENYFRVNNHRLLQTVLYPTYLYEQELTRGQAVEAHRIAESRQQASDAFYTANPDLNHPGVYRLVTRVSDEIQRQYGGQCPTAQWITLTGHQVRKELRAMGVDVALRAPATNELRSRMEARGRDGAFTPPAEYVPRRVRPAAMDFGGGSRATVARPKSREETVEQQIIDLAGWQRRPPRTVNYQARRA